MSLNSYLRDFVSQFDIRLAPWDGFDVLSIDDQQFKVTFEHIVDGFPEHSSPNVAKNVLDWEYTTEILRSDLRTRLRDPLQALPPTSVLSHEGSCPQDPGALHVQSIPSSASASGDQRHV
jgi:hypothetical protein